MKLLIIGGTGVLSSAVVKEALANNISVTIVNRGKNGRSVPNGVEVITADYRNEAIMRSKLEGRHFDSVIDFICFTQPQIKYSINLLHSYADQYIFISTTCVYNTEIPGIKREDSEKVLTSWNYSVDKWECEKYLAKESRNLGFNYTIVRPCVTYDDTRIPYGIMPPYGYHWTFISRILNHKPIIRWDGGSARWNMMRVEDFAVGVVGLLGNKKSFGEAYNLSGDEAYSWNDVLNAIEKCIGVEPIIFDITSEEYMQSYPSKKGEISGRAKDAIVDNSKIKQIVPSYHTKYNLEEGIQLTIDAYRDQNYQKGIDYTYDGETDRIIERYCKSKGVNSSEFNLSFIDYIGNAGKNEERMYNMAKNSDYIVVKLQILLSRIINRLKR